MPSHSSSSDPRVAALPPKERTWKVKTTMGDLTDTGEALSVCDTFMDFTHSSSAAAVSSLGIITTCLRKVMAKHQMSSSGLPRYERLPTAAWGFSEVESVPLSCLDEDGGGVWGATP